MDLKTKDFVAIKIMKEKHINTCKKLEAFMNEVRLLFQCRHPGIIQILSVSVRGTLTKRKSMETRRVVYYSMKYAKDGEFYQLLQHTGKLDETVGKKLLMQLIDGKTLFKF